MRHNPVSSSSPRRAISGQPCASDYGDLSPRTAYDEVNQAIQQGIFTRDEGNDIDMMADIRVLEPTIGQ